MRSGALLDVVLDIDDNWIDDMTLVVTTTTLEQDNYVGF